MFGQLGNLLRKLTGGEEQPGLRQVGGDAQHMPSGMQMQQGLRTNEQKAQAPFKMYEDNSFQGNPKGFLQNNPQFKFYEDGNFSAPQPLSVSRFGGFGQASPGGYEDHPINGAQNAGMLADSQPRNLQQPMGVNQLQGGDFSNKLRRSLGL